MYIMTQFRIQWGLEHFKLSEINFCVSRDSNPLGVEPWYGLAPLKATAKW